jgi:uncharacterized SAM-dependent methyltransferase
MPHFPDAPVSVFIHPNQFPQAVEASLGESLRTREMNHRFHYDTPKQTLRWLRLHEAFSPARTDPDCSRIYESAFAHVAERSRGVRELEVVSLGCGGGQKDAQLLRRLASALPGVRLRYVPVDVSAGLALTARAAAIEAGLGPEDIVPVLVDLGESTDWASALAVALGSGEQRLVCFLGMLPNFTPASVMPRLAGLLRPRDLLLVSANLSPGPDYVAGVERVLPGYDNLLTREWLWSVLLDLGLEARDARMDFSLAGDGQRGGLLRIESRLTFSRNCRLSYAGDVHEFGVGETFRLFFSYRYTPERLDARLQAHGMTVQGSWGNASGEEGVFVCATCPEAGQTSGPVMG